VCVPDAVFTHEICELRPKQVSGFVADAGIQLVPPWPASATTSFPLKKSTPRGLSKPDATATGAAAAATPGLGMSVPAASSRIAASGIRIFRRN